MVDPEFHHVVDGGIGEFIEVHHRLGRLEHAGRLKCGGPQDVDRVRRGKVVIEAHLDVAGGGHRRDIEIHDFGLGDVPVGDDDEIVVVGVQRDGPPGHIDHPPLVCAADDPVAQGEGGRGLHHQPGEKIAQRFLEGQAQHDGDDGRAGEELVDIPAEGGGTEEEDRKNGQDDIDDLVEESRHGDLAAAGQDGHQGEPVDDAQQDEEHRGGEKADDPEIDGVV
jgi:hypothetical protein